MFPPKYYLGNLTQADGVKINSGYYYGYPLIFFSNPAGDINADGKQDLIIGSPSMNSNSGQTFIVYGNHTFPAEIKLEFNNNFYSVINGANNNDNSGHAVFGPGDINSDGIDDFIIAAPAANSSYGEVYVIFGDKGGFPSKMNLKDFDSIGGFKLITAEKEMLGSALNGGGDYNGDGIPDILISGSSDAVTIFNSYVVFGSKEGFPNTVNVTALDGSNGFALNPTFGLFSGQQIISNAGDINDDGIDDIIAACKWGACVLYGTNKGFPSTYSIDSSNLNGTNGFYVNGFLRPMPLFVSSAGDFNGDGIDDVVIATMGCKYYVLFGREGNFPATINVNQLNGTVGIEVFFDGMCDLSSYVNNLGDFNKDGYTDLIIGIPSANFYDYNQYGGAYIVYGNQFPQPKLNLSELNGINGFEIEPVLTNPFVRIGATVCGMDLNNDGVNDAIISQSSTNQGAYIEVMDAYVLYGENNSPTSDFQGA